MSENQHLWPDRSDRRLGSAAAVLNVCWLAGRRWWKARSAHLAAVLITAAVLSGWLSFWAYAAALSQDMSGKVSFSKLPAAALVFSPSGGEDISWQGLVQRVYSYRQLEVGTAHGLARLGVVTASIPETPLPQPKDDEVWLADELAVRWQADSGECLTLRLPQGDTYRTVQVRLAGTYRSAAYLPQLLVNQSGLIAQGVVLPTAEWLLFNREASSLHADRYYDLWRQRLPSGTTVLTDDSIVAAARSLVGTVYKGGQTIVTLLLLFLALGVGTFLLLIYLDNRRELAILKSLGLRPWEVMSVCVLESLCTAVLGFALAALITRLSGRLLGLPMLFTAAVYRRCLALQAIAFFAATVAPCKFSLTASVNELMFTRPIPLFRRAVLGLERRHPAWEEKLAAGYCCLQLPAQDTNSICLRLPGQSVKQGEAVAWEQSAWGLVERSFIAPCNGTVVQVDRAAGMMLIRPADNP